MFPMSSILEHVCTFFIVNATRQESFLKIILDARQIAIGSISATTTCESELVIKAHREDTEGDVLVKREVCQVLTVPPDVEVLRAKFTLLRNGYLVIHIPFKLIFSNSFRDKPPEPVVPEVQNPEEDVCSRSPPSKIQQLTYAIGSKNNGNQLDRHQTTRNGNQLLLRIPLDHPYSLDGVVVKVVNRSVCVSATRIEKSSVAAPVRPDGKPYMIQRNFYKEYEASDLIPDPDSITYDIKDNWLLVKVSVMPDVS